MTACDQYTPSLLVYKSHVPDYYPMQQSVVHSSSMAGVPYPTSSPNPIFNNQCAYGTSGSDVLFISADHSIKAIVSDASFQEAPYRYIVPDPTGIGYSWRFGDRLEDGKLIYTDAPYFTRGVLGTRIVIDSGRGPKQSSIEEFHMGSTLWMSGLMAYTSIEIGNALVDRSKTRLLLFDIGRGKIEEASKMETRQPLYYITTMTGVVLQPKIALLSINSTVSLADMRTRTTTILQEATNTLQTTYSCATAGCRVFFPQQEYGRKEPNNKEQVLVKPYLGDRCFTIYPNGINGTIDHVYAWSPAQGPLAMTMCEGTITDSDLYRRISSVRLFDTRRHVSFEVPGSRSENYSSVRKSSPLPMFAPTHVTGQPCLTMISDKGTFMIM